MSSKVTKSLSACSAESSTPPPNPSKRFLHSDSSVSYQFSNVSSTINQDSIKEIISRSVSYMNDDLETNTSKSLVHGLILVTIMITSLIAFICSKVRRCSHQVDIYNFEDCSKYFLFYSIMTIVSCLITFTIYFLHLIAQCDILCLTKRKYGLEIFLITLVASLLAFSTICYMLHTDIFTETFTLTSFIFTSISILLYVVRIVFLFGEKISKQRKKRQMNRSFRPNQANLENGTTSSPARVISYVRNSQRKKTLSTSASDEIEDEVFIQ